MENITQHKPYEEMVLAAVGGINDDAGSTEDDILQYITSSYGGLPPNYRDVVKIYLERLVREQLIGSRPVYFTRHPGEGFSNPIIEAIVNLEHRGGSTECSITEYICKKLSVPPESCNFPTHLKDQLAKLVDSKVIGISNVYFLLFKGKQWFNRIDVPYYNDPGLEKWKRCKTTSVEGHVVRDWEESETKKAKIKQKSIAKIMRDTKPRPFRMEDI